MSIDVFPATVLNATLWNGQTYEEGTFTVTATGFSGTAPSGTARYVRVGKQITLFLPQLSGTSNATTFTISGILPQLVCPVVANCRVIAQDNSAWQDSIIGVDGNTTWSVAKFPSFAAWTASGTKTLGSVAISYCIV